MPSFVKSIVAVHILIPHSWHFCSIILYVAKWSVVWCELLNPAWSSACSWSSVVGYNLLYIVVEKSLYNACNEQFGRYLPTFSTSPFLWITFMFTFFHASDVNSFCFMISLKICLTISLVSSSHALMSSARIPLLSGDLPFF